MDSGMTNEEFGRVVEQYQKLVYTICYQMVRDHYEAQNLAQETFLSAYTHIDRCREEDMKPWLCRIASNKAKDHLKSAYVRRVQLAREEEDAQENTGPGRRGIPPGGTEASPEELYTAADGAETIREMIRSLHEPYLNRCSTSWRKRTWTRSLLPWDAPAKRYRPSCTGPSNRCKR